MEKEIKEYLENVSRLLNGQLRGAINGKAKEENLQLIQLTMGDVFERAFNLGITSEQQKQALNKLKEELKDDNNDN